MSFRVVEWLYPGMRVKRWVLLLVAGIVLFYGGLVLSIGELTARTVVGWLFAWWASVGWASSAVRIGVGTLLGLCGAAMVVVGIRQLVRTLLYELAPEDADNVADIMFVRRTLRRGPRVVVLGGGTGLSTLLRGLKEYTSNITAVVTVADDGGSSGLLRAEFGMLPPGDIRNTLVALADSEPLMEQLFQYRFQEGNGLAGHSFGNLFITALMQVVGDFEQAVQESSRVLNIRGTVLPSTLQPVTLHAIYSDGSETAGESRIPQPGKPIARVYLTPADPPPLAEALRAIANADLVVLGPGSLYTSVMPNLLVPQIAAAIRNCAAVKVYACNVMTQPGETDGFSAADHLQAVIAHTGPGIVHYCLANNAPVAGAAADRYREQGAFPVQPDAGRIKAMGVTPVLRPIVSETNLVRHDSAALAKAVLEVAGLWRPPVRSRRSARAQRV